MGGLPHQAILCDMSLVSYNLILGRKMLQWSYHAGNYKGFRHCVPGTRAKTNVHILYYSHLYLFIPREMNKEITVQTEGLGAG